MKIQIKDYTFNSSTKQITFTDYTTIRLDSMLLITNVTDNIIIYNFASSLLGGTVSGNVLTLTYDTLSMSNSDNLQIFYEDDNDMATLISTLQDKIASDGLLQRQLLQLLRPLGVIVSGSGRLSLDVNALPTLANVTTVGTVTNITNLPTLANVTTVASLTNQVNIGGLNALDLQFNMAHTAWNTGMRANITF